MSNPVCNCLVDHSFSGAGLSAARGMCELITIVATIHTRMRSFNVIVSPIRSLPIRAAIGVSGRSSYIPYGMSVKN
jgi:hypothetical protein